jgi:hypothetical protein
MEAPLERVVPAQSVNPMPRRTEHAPGLVRQGSYRSVRSYGTSSHCLLGDATDGAASNARYGPQQVPGLRTAMQSAGNFSHAPRKLRGYARNSFREPGKRFLCHGHHGFCHHRKQFAGSHSDERQEVFRGFLFCLRFRGQFSEVLHHRVGVDFANGVFELSLELPFEFSLAFKFALAFAEKAAYRVADGAQPAFAFHFPLEFSLTFEFALELGFEFILGLVCHDPSSLIMWRPVSERG